MLALHERFGSSTLLLYGALAMANALLVIGMMLLAATQYVDRSLAGLAGVALGAAGLGAACIVDSARRMVSALAPAMNWLGAGRDPDAAPAAWLAAVRGIDRVLLIGVTEFCIAYLPLAVFAVAELGLPAYDVPALYAFFVVGVLFAATLDYFGFHWLLRPVVEEVAAQIPLDFAPPYRTMSLRARLWLVGTILSTVIAVFTGSVGDLVVGPNRFALELAIVGAVMLVVGLIPAWLLAEDVTRPYRDLLAATVAAQRGVLSTRVPIRSADEGGAVAGQFNRMMRGLQDREALRSAMGTYVDPGITERVLAEGQRLQGEEVEGSVMFVDIRRFTNWCDEHTAEEAVALLNQFFETIVPCIAAHGGHANKFLGDGVLAVFGAPIRCDDHADRAVSAAHAIVAAIRDSFGDGLTVGIGINSGTFVVGTVGGGGRLEYGIIGDSVNTASRVEQLTKTTGDQILATESTVMRLMEASVARPRGALAVRGKVEPVTVYALCAAPASSLAEPFSAGAGPQIQARP